MRAEILVCFFNAISQYVLHRHILHFGWQNEYEENFKHHWKILNSEITCLVRTIFFNLIPVKPALYSSEVFKFEDSPIFSALFCLHFYSFWCMGTHIEHVLASTRISYLLPIPNPFIIYFIIPIPKISRAVWKVVLTSTYIQYYRKPIKPTLRTLQLFRMAVILWSSSTSRHLSL